MKETDTHTHKERHTDTHKEAQTWRYRQITHTQNKEGKKQTQREEEGKADIK